MDFRSSKFFTELLANTYCNLRALPEASQRTSAEYFLQNTSKILHECKIATKKVQR